jgi:hypothetical protein
MAMNYYVVHAYRRRCGGAATRVVVWVAGIACALILVAVLWHASAMARLSDLKGATMAHAQDLAWGVVMYAQDNDDLLPPTMDSVGQMRPILYTYVESLDSDVTTNPAGGQFLGNQNIAGARMPDGALLTAIPTLYESRAWADDRRAVTWLDGHAGMQLHFDPAHDLKDIHGK